MKDIKQLNLKDGLYRVETEYLCAGFIVRNGIIVRCAPILQKNIYYWITKAKKLIEIGGK